jgi:RNA polymerase sigma factor (TIGR02999 family)
MCADDTHRVTVLLGRWREGDGDALDDLIPVVYAELRRLANAQLQRDPGATIQPTELIAEAYLALVGADSINWQGRAHFFSIAARTMRRVLVERFRRRTADKRGGQRSEITLDEALVGDTGRTLDLEKLDDALRELEALDPRQAEIVTLKFFGGLKVEEIAEVLAISPRTVKREWAMARLWLYRSLGQT